MISEVQRRQEDTVSREEKKTDRIQNLAQQCLSKSAYYELRRVCCENHEGIITLHGTVSSFYFKQVAQTIVGKIGEVGQVINRLEVVYHKIVPKSL